MRNWYEQFHGIPIWEITVVMLAMFFILLVVVLWYFLGFKLVIAPSGVPKMDLPVSAFVAALL